MILNEGTGVSFRILSNLLFVRLYIEAIYGRYIMYRPLEEFLLEK
jgi:hypothetical protein